MKFITLSELEDLLAENPEDWSLRLRLIEGHILEDDIESARRVVRESPGESPLPPELQYRLHTAMTQGAPAIERFYASEEGAKVPFVRAHQAEPEPVETADGAEAETDGESPESTDKGGDDEPEPEFKGPLPPTSKIACMPDGRSREASAAAGESHDGGTGRNDGSKSDRQGKAESEKTGSEELSKGSKQREEDRKADEDEDENDADKPAPMKRLKPVPFNKPDGFEFSDEEDEEYEELLQEVSEREPQAAQKVSAFTLALVTHLALVIICGAVVIGLPSPKPPQIVAVNVMSERDPVIAPRLVERDTPKAASASAQPAPIISTTSDSSFAVPEFDANSSPDVTVLMTGVDIGDGMSFSGTGRESNVNFFGIRSGGKRIAFIVDATRYMLLDEKGGMFAYDKVKAEVGAMLAQLKRGTAFNIILYEGGTLSLFREEPVAAKPSAVRMAIEWLEPLNRNYQALGLGQKFSTRGQVNEGVGIVEARDIHSYAKAIQAAMEMDVNAVFAISSGYRRISRSLSPEQVAEMRKMNEGRTSGSVDPQARASWNQAVAKTREWLSKENAARAEKGLAPKVVINFNALVRQVTGATPPRATGGSPAPSGMPRPGPPYTPDEIEDHFEEVVKHYYKENNKSVPEVHLVLFLGEDEDIGDAKDHFRRLTRKNKGKLKILKGLAALTDVTGK